MGPDIMDITDITDIMDIIEIATLAAAIAAAVINAAAISAALHEIMVLYQSGIGLSATTGSVGIQSGLAIRSTAIPVTHIPVLIIPGGKHPSRISDTEAFGLRSHMNTKRRRDLSTMKQRCARPQEYLAPIIMPATLNQDGARPQAYLAAIIMPATAKNDHRGRPLAFPIIMPATSSNPRVERSGVDVGCGLTYAQPTVIADAERSFTDRS